MHVAALHDLQTRCILFRHVPIIGAWLHQVVDRLDAKANHGNTGVAFQSRIWHARRFKLAICSANEWLTGRSNNSEADHLA